MTKFTKTIILLAFINCQVSIINSVNAQQKGEPFEGIDQTWQNGTDRRDSSVFKNVKYFTPSVLMDVNYRRRK